MLLRKTPGDHLCSFGSPILWPVQQRIVLLCHHHPVINNDCSSSWHPLLKPHRLLRKSKSRSPPLEGVVAQQCFCSGGIREKIRKRSHRTAWCDVTRRRTSFGFSLSLFLPSTYLPETPFPGRWPSQFASSLSKHFTGERLDLHLSIASHHMPMDTHTHMPPCTITHTDVKLALMLTTKISFSRTQMRQTSSQIWVTRLTVD